GARFQSIMQSRVYSTSARSGSRPNRARDGALNGVAFVLFIVQLRLGLYECCVGSRIRRISGLTNRSSAIFYQSPAGRGIRRIGQAEARLSDSTRPRSARQANARYSQPVFLNRV